MNWQLIVGLFAGGLGGAVFTWYMNRTTDAQVQYRVTTTTLGTGPAVRSLVPNLRLRVGDEEVSAISAHTVEISAAQGYVDRVQAAIVFDKTVQLYGSVITASPSPLHAASCTQIPTGAKCVLTPLAPGKGTFRISMATDEQQKPRVVIVAKGVEVHEADAVPDRRDGFSSVSLAITFAALMSAVSMVVEPLVKRLRNPK